MKMLVGQLISRLEQMESMLKLYKPTKQIILTSLTRLGDQSTKLNWFIIFFQWSI